MSTDGPIWVAERLNGKPVIRGTVLTLSTSEDGGGGYDGCNRFTGIHEDGSLVARPDGTISFPGFGGTLAFCDHPRGTVTQQDSYLEALADAKQYQVQDHRLQIRDGSGNLRLVMVNKSPLVGDAADLTGTAWRLTSSDGKAPRGMPPTLAFWDEAFVGGTVADYGFVAQYDKWRTGYRIRSLAVTGAETRRVSRIKDRKVRDILQAIGGWDRHAVRDEDGIRLLRVRTGSGSPVDFQELMPAMNQISDAKWRLRSFIEVRRHEFRAGGPPCVENALPGSDIVARFTETSVRGIVDRREYNRDDLGLSVVTPGESSADGLAGLDRRGTGLPDGECLSEDEKDGIERDPAAQVERYLELLPKLQRYMIFGDRLVVLTDSHQALLFQAERSG
jgi:heat shock protein HslJ